MRIGLMAPPWVPVPPPAYGGTEAVIDRLARGFVAAGHDVMLWASGDSTCPVPKGHVLARAATAQMGLATVELRHVIRGYAALREWGAEVIHDHTLTGPIFGQRYSDVILATTNHGPFHEDLLELYRAVDDDVAVIAISHHQASQATGVKIAATIHHGLDVDAFPVGDGSGDAEGEYFLFLGRMVPEKGARRAAAAARKAGVRLLIAAKMQEPLEYRFFAEEIEPLLGDKVVYLGEVGTQERLRLLQGARALVNPIRWAEPFGLVMIEALACGTPVLSFRKGSAPEIIEHGLNGYISDNEDQLARDILRAHTLDRAACRRSAEERFTTDRMVEDHLDLFRSLIEQRSGAALIRSPAGE